MTARSRSYLHRRIRTAEEVRRTECDDGAGQLRAGEGGAFTHTIVLTTKPKSGGEQQFACGYECRPS